MKVLNKALFALSCSVLAQSAVAQQASDGVVKIGILNDQSGVYADFGGKWSVEAARMAVQDFGGKVLGVPVEIVNADHQNKPDVASNIARQWYDIEKVDTIMELTTSSVALAVQGLSKEKKKIDIVTGAATTDLTGKQCSPYGFHWAYDTHALAVGTGGALVERRQQVVLPDGRLRLRLLAGRRHPRVREVKGRQGRRLGAPSASNATDYSSFLLQAQSFGREGDRPRQCRPRYLQRDQAGRRIRHHPGGQRLAALLFTLAEVNGLGLQAAQGLTLTEGFYWDQSDEDRAPSPRNS